MFKRFFSNKEESSNLDLSRANPQVIIDQPSEIKIRLVPDNDFKQYELFMTLAVLFLPIGASFLTSNLTTKFSTSSLLSTIAFLFAGCLFLGLGLMARRRILGTRVVRKSISFAEFKSK